MAGILGVVASLKEEFETAQTHLRNVDDNIKRLTGREPGLARGGKPKPVEVEEGELVEDDPPRTRKFIGSAFSRVYVPGRGRRMQLGHGGDFNNAKDFDDDDDEDLAKKPVIQSSVMPTQREIKPRSQALEEQKADKKGMARNRRMFGMILGTLQKFQSEETKRTETTQKRTEIEKKLEAAQEKEKADIRMERIKLFKFRREQQAHIRRIEQKMERIEIHQEWEKSHQFLGKFIQTKTKPCLFYMPVKMSPECEKRLKETRDKYRLILAEKRAKVQKELFEIDELYKKQDEEANMDGIEEMEENNANADHANVPAESGKGIIGDEDMEVDSGEKQTLDDDSKPKEVANENEKENENSDSLGDKEFEPIYDE